jgi:hypothetical protein
LRAADAIFAKEEAPSRQEKMTDLLQFVQSARYVRLQKRLGIQVG